MYSRSYLPALILVLVLLLSACGAEPEKTTAAPSDSTAESQPETKGEPAYPEFKIPEKPF